MASSNFKQISPSITFREFDNSQTPAALEDVGPVVIGRAQRGPAMRPVQVSSYEEFVEYFGEPTQNSDFTDVWRDNVIVGPSYGSMAAQASLANKNSLTFVRLLGVEDPEATAAGKAGWNYGSISNLRTGGAYGLFIFPSGSVSESIVTGTLAAVWYCTGSVALSGSAYTNPSGAAVTGTAGLVLSDTNKNFCVQIKDQNGNIVEKSVFNFSPSSDRFVRKVFNTNPTVTNLNVFQTTKSYFLGESFEDFINSADETGAIRNASRLVGVILALKNNATSDELSSRKMPAQHGRTGWFVSQDFGSSNIFQLDNTQKLFKIHAFDSGEWPQANIKISIRNIRVSANDVNRYGTFDVLVRQISDSDSNPVIIEQFNNCNLNPNDVNYVGAKIGDKYTIYDATEQRNVEVGQFDNRSKFIRIEMHPSVEAGVITPECLPFGVYGPVKFRDFSFSSASIGLAGSKFGEFSNATTSFTGAFVLGANSIADNLNGSVYTGSVFFGDATATIKTASVVFPYPRLRSSTLSGTLRQPSDAFFGVYTDDSNLRFSRAVKDLVRCLPAGVDSFTPSTPEGTDYAWKFTLDDLTYAGSSTEANYVTGSRLAGTSITAVTSYNTVLTGGFNAFTTLLAGGFDGLDITEIEPFRNSGMTGVTAKTSYEFNTIQRAIRTLEHPEDVSFSDAAIPGVNVPGLTRQLVEVCAQRGDAFAIIDLENDYIPRAESTAEFSARLPNVDAAIASLKTRGINTNYGCGYFPWVQGRDVTTNNIVWIPPSVSILGVYAYNDRVGAKHTAPAGFNRGGLTDGHGGVPVINVSKKLTEKERDKLYQANINPIAYLEKKVVVYGQKTFQIKASALDRINVRRGILDIRRKFASIAQTLQFEPNVSDTWNEFLRQATPILDDIVAKLGLEKYELIMDSTTNTPDLRDRNIIYGKVYLWPTRTGEYFILDFNINGSGAGFAE